MKKREFKIGDKVKITGFSDKEEIQKSNSISIFDDDCTDLTDNEHDCRSKNDIGRIGVLDAWSGDKPEVIIMGKISDETLLLQEYTIELVKAVDSFF